MKNLLEQLNSRFEWMKKKESANLKWGQLKLFSLRSRKEKNEEKRTEPRHIWDTSITPTETLWESQKDKKEEKGGKRK